MGVNTKLLLKDEEIRELYFLASEKVLSFKDKFSKGIKEVFLENDEIIMVFGLMGTYTPKVLDDEDWSRLQNKLDQLNEMVTI